MTESEFENIELGDYVVVEYTGKGHLGGGRVRGKVIESWLPDHRQFRVESGWCFHPKDKLLQHNKAKR